MDKIIVVDTSVFVASIISSNGASRAIIKKCLKSKFQPIMGTALFHEYEDVLSRKSTLNKSPINANEINVLLDSFLSVCDWIDIYYLWRPNLLDESDNHIIELAVAGNAEIVVTHNIKDFKQNQLSFPQLKILTPAQLMRISS